MSKDKPETYQEHLDSARERMAEAENTQQKAGDDDD